MKTTFLSLICMSALVTSSCSDKKNTQEQDALVESSIEALDQEQTIQEKSDNTMVYVYYFHGKQRCKTCLAVGDLTKKTVEGAFASNELVKFIEVDTSEKQYSDLVEKYEVTWNALIIAKGDDSINLTEDAFATALTTPKVLEELIVEQVNKKL
ncbi:MULTISPECIES: nitrophenyl compound nitroreductase subunit ArsF family protein [Myroides]|uniref:nitrophenyl compound nitroreductase subunit ArsF family protein n=1 Tax=Myroides TaxID=76831 RepID=UPI002578E8D9|nr:nitrophenyl compound nitroreductase subunit ArsF family protein [Myroides odoratimimus]MDM1035995.1 hypothetical protein [Myroides odoratimimus]